MAKATEAKRTKYKIGQLVWCPQLGTVLILGILRHSMYEHNLLVETFDRPGRYWIDQGIIQPRPEGRRELESARRRTYTRLLTHEVYVPPN